MEKSPINSPASSGLALSLEQQDSSAATDYFEMSVPVTKLDADQYSAEDLDGVTESLFGSGNLNFLLMQAGQTNEAMALSDPFIIVGEAPGPLGGLSSTISFGDGLTNSSSPFALDSNNNDISTDRNVADDATSFSDGGAGSNGGYTASTVLPLAASGFVLNGGGAAPVIPTNGIDGESFDGNDGSDGRNGVDGEGGGNIINVDIDNFLDIDIGDIIIKLGDIDLGDITIIDLGDVTNIITTTITEITNLVDILNITEITNNVTNIVNNIFNNIFGGDGLTVHLDTILGEVTNLDLDILSGDSVFNVVNEIVDLSPVTNLLDPILGTENLVLVDLHSILSILDGNNDHRPGDTDLGLGIELPLLGDAHFIDGIVDVVFNPVEDVVGDIDILGDIGLGLFAPDHSAGDTDLNLGLDLDIVDNGLLDPVLDIGLDPVEDIVGDIDIDLGVAVDLLGDTADGLVDNFAGGTGEDSLLAGAGEILEDLGGDVIDGLLPGLDNDGGVAPDLDLDLLGDNETDTLAGDTDITLDIDLDPLGIDTPDLDFADIELDPVEEIIGDIDLDIDNALDLLGTLPGSGLGDLAGGVGGGEDPLSWPENILPNAGDIIDGGLGDALGSVLPEPAGDVAEGLGSLLNDQGGGLFSGGGLFG